VLETTRRCLDFEFASSIAEVDSNQDHLQEEFMKLRGGALRNFSIGLIAIALSVLAHAQTSRWARPDEPTATMMIDMERKWAEAGCDHSGIERTILAEDFYGTASAYQLPKQTAIILCSGMLSER
jgi:hypothetical protein